MYAVSCFSAEGLPSAFHLIIHSFMGKVKVILYRKDGSKIGKLELESDKDIREQLLPLKSRLGVYAYQLGCSLWDRIRPKFSSLLPTTVFIPRNESTFSNPNPIIAIDSGKPCFGTGTFPFI